MEIKNKKFVVWIFAFVFILASAMLAADNSTKQCRLTAECDNGYCENGYCTFPTVLENYKVTGTCITTADCQVGFCRNGQCILLQRQEYTIINLGVKSGCAGIIEDCTGIWCYFCNITWILLLVGAVVAAWAGRKRGRLTPILMAIIPIGFGIFLLPILGFLLAVVEIVILLVIKKEKVQVRGITAKPVWEISKPVQGISKPVQVSGKEEAPPISESVEELNKQVHISSKPVQVSSKPVQVSSKPVQVSSKSVQVNGKEEAQVKGKEKAKESSK